MKRTHYWLKNLPPLQYNLQNTLFDNATACNKPEPISIEIIKKSGKTKRRHFTDSISNGNIKSGHERSKSFQSVANAMAIQWTNYINNLK